MNSEAISFLAGLFMPAVVELVKVKIPEKRWLCYSIALGSSVIVGGLTALMTDQLNTVSVLGSIGAVFIASQSVYNYWWKESKLAEKIIKIRG